MSLGFFDAIFIKAADMRDGSYYDETDKVWIWKYEEHPLYMDVGKSCSYYAYIVLTSYKCSILLILYLLFEYE